MTDDTPDPEAFADMMNSQYGNAEKMMGQPAYTANVEQTEANSEMMKANTKVLEAKAKLINMISGALTLIVLVALVTGIAWVWTYLFRQWF